MDGSDEKPRTGIPAILKTALVIQIVLLGVMIFVPFGFDHASSWGLDFGHLILAAGSYVAALLVGLVVAGLRKRWLLLAVQILVPTLLVLSFIFASPGITSTPPDLEMQQEE